jgi:hypothetical protein
VLGHTLRAAEPKQMVKRAAQTTDEHVDSPIIPASSQPAAPSTIRDIAGHLTEHSSEPASRFAEGLFDFEHQSATLGLSGALQVRTLRDQYRYAVRWLLHAAAGGSDDADLDASVIEQIVELADDLELTAVELEKAYDSQASIDPDRLHDLHRRLVAIFA